MLALTENNSFINRLFLMEATPLEFGFFTERSDPEKWSVGSMMIVCMIRVLSSHIHKADVNERLSLTIIIIIIIIVIIVIIVINYHHCYHCYHSKPL